MGHHYSIPYSGGGLIVINVQAHLAWALAEKCGHPIDEKAWKNSFSEVSKSLDRKTGALGYSSRAPGSPDISARTGAMATALMVAGRDKNFANSLAESLVRFNGRMRHAHAMSSIRLIFGFSGIKQGSPRKYSEVMETWIPCELFPFAQWRSCLFRGEAEHRGRPVPGASFHRQRQRWHDSRQCGKPALHARRNPQGLVRQSQLGVTPSQSFACHVKVLFDRFSFVCFVHLFSSGGKHKAKLHFHFDR